MLKKTAILGGVLGIVISLAAQLFAVMDNAYTIGNIGLLGALAGVIGIVSGYQIDKRTDFSLIGLGLAIILGTIALSFLYLIPTVLMIIPFVYIFNNR
ncbi:hypothetical protein KFZ58_06275 [Virgibacillus sp. NKC19-16]|uniref:hypothetical protein n=1 Tax=Virgibacillus salidurans TaxID=2831673 RepID=UPI001F1846D8|nr:hypothetical protein [Virgibacillus sp. NKC19-16]UJL47479.1 hypothetical protein KFZ58_06275 [Virgibacillus sp. NKC19-16]